MKHRDPQKTPDKKAQPPPPPKTPENYEPFDEDYTLLDEEEKEQERQDSCDD